MTEEEIADLVSRLDDIRSRLSDEEHADLKREIGDWIARLRTGSGSRTPLATYRPGTQPVPVPDIKIGPILRATGELLEAVADAVDHRRDAGQ